MSDNPADWKTWQDVSAKEQNLIDGLLDQWRQLVGYQVNPPEWALLEMAKGQIGSVYAMGQYMVRHVPPTPGANTGAYFVPASVVQNQPGAQFGMTADQFASKLDQYQNIAMQYLGNTGGWDQFASLMNSTQGQWTSQHLIEQLLNDPATIQAYGWLKYGLTHDQFQQQKVQMRQQFGFEFDDKDAVAQLQYYHQASSAQFAVHAQPTFSQQEKKQANVGLTGGGAAIR